MKYQPRIIYLLLANIILFPLLVSQGWAQAGGSADCPLPPADVLGEDIAGFSRYPHSVRTRFIRETDKSIIWLNQQAKGMEATYRSNDGMNNILDFYNRQFKEQGWEVFSSNYIGENSVHIVLSRKEKQILLILRPYSSGFISPRRSTALREEFQPPPKPTTPTNCYVIQVFSWDEADAKPLERRTRSLNDQDQLPRRIGR